MLVHFSFVEPLTHCNKNHANLSNAAHLMLGVISLMLWSCKDATRTVVQMKMNMKMSQSPSQSFYMTNEIKIEIEIEMQIEKKIDMKIAMKIDMKRDMKTGVQTVTKIEMRKL